MSDPSGQGTWDPWARSVNQRFRARWHIQLRWATTIAVGIHVLIFAFLPTWATFDLAPDPDAWEGSRLLAIPSFGGAPLLRSAPEIPVALAEGEDDETDAEPLLQEGAVATDLERGDLWDALGERLRRDGFLAPTIAEPRIEPEPERVEEIVSTEEGASATEDDDPAIGGDASAIDLSVLTLPDSLRLDRLSALRPDLAFMTASAWVLIRNPSEVATFMRRAYLEGTLDESVLGSVSVTLWIDRRGSVEWAEISESSGEPELDEYALALFNEVADFRPARERGVTVSRSVTLSLRFPW